MPLFKSAIVLVALVLLLICRPESFRKTYQTAEKKVERVKVVPLPATNEKKHASEVKGPPQKQLVKSVSATTSTTTARAIEDQFGHYVRIIAHEHGRDPSLIRAIIAVESAGNPRSVGKIGERGLMQVSPAACREIGCRFDRLFDPRENIRAGVEYLSHLKRLGFTKTDELLLAYNRGPTRARELLNRGVPAEEWAYVQKVKAYLS